MTHPRVDAAAWAPWVTEVAAALGVEPSRVPITDIVDLAGAVSAGFVRPMAPVSAFLWGFALATHPDADPATLEAAILAALPGTAP